MVPHETDYVRALKSELASRGFRPDSDEQREQPVHKYLLCLYDVLWTAEHPNSVQWTDVQRATGLSKESCCRWLSKSRLGRLLQQLSIPYRVDRAESLGQGSLLSNVWHIRIEDVRRALDAGIH